MAASMSTCAGHERRRHRPHEGPVSAQEEETSSAANKALITIGAMLAGLMAFLDISIATWR